LKKQEKSVKEKTEIVWTFNKNYKKVTRHDIIGPHYEIGGEEE
jgi:hypothetical protein